MGFFNIFTSHGDKLRQELDINQPINKICEYLYSMVENIEYINLFQLTLRHDNTILLPDKTLKFYNLSADSKLTFVIRRKSIDFNSPTIYDSPASITSFKEQHKKNDIENMLNELNKNILSLTDQFYSLKDEIKYIKSDINDIRFHIDNIKKDIDCKKPEDIFEMLA